MRKLFAALMMLLFTCFVFGQGKRVVVTLKSGVTITGQVKELVATDHVTLIVAGTESVISMSDVSSIETEDTEAPSQSGSVLPQPEKLIVGQHTIFDKKEYPDSLVFDSEGNRMVFLLVRGGSFTMGYDGRHSWAMATEPLHKVTLSSYYISKQCVTRGLASTLNQKKATKKQNKAYMAKSWDKANEIVSALSNKLGHTFRLVTEAEWEYVSIMPQYENIFERDKHFEWCSDFYSEEYPKEEQINPTGPIKGKRHVIRSFDAGRNKWQRNFSLQTNNYAVEPQVRIAICVDKIIK